MLVNGALGYVQERQAERAVAALQRMAAPAARVVRDGREQDVDAEGVVPGDLIVLGEGDAVTADGRLLETTYLTVAEAALTGESEPSLKASPALPQEAVLGDRSNMVFSGTSITRGRGIAVVTATGMATEIGRIAALLGETQEEPTPLQREVGRLGRALGLGVVAIAAVVVAAVFVTSEVRTLSDVVDVLLLGVSLAVAAVPEGLPAILTVVLALGVQRMARQNAIVKKLSSVETLGSASVICTDKTGTLTQNEMTIVRIATRSGDVTVSGSGYRPEGDLLVDGRPLGPGPARSEVRAVLGGGSSASDALLEEHDGEWTIHGDPTEAAFLVAERKLGTAERRIERFTRRSAIPFSSERKLMSTVMADEEHESRLVVMTKGAPGLVLARCSRERIGSGEEPLTDIRRGQLSAVVDRLADSGLRTLAVAYRPLDTSHAAEPDEALEHDLVLAGVVGMMDPARPEAPAAVAEAQRAGVRVVMITGDHQRTARRIAIDLGLIRADGDAMRGVVSGAQLDAMDDATPRAPLPGHASVFARVSPEHKLQIVRALKDERARSRP